MKLGGTKTYRYAKPELALQIIKSIISDRILKEIYFDLGTKFTKLVKKKLSNMKMS